MKYPLELGRLFTPIQDVSHFDVYYDFIRSHENCDFGMKCLGLETADTYGKVTLADQRLGTIFSYRIKGKDSVYYEDIFSYKCLTMIPCEVNEFELVGYLSRCYGVPYNEMLSRVDTYGFYIPKGLEVKIV